MTTDRSIRNALDAAAEHASAQMQQCLRRDGWRNAAGPALALIIIVPAVVVVVQLVRIITGGAPGSLYSWWLAPAALIPPAAFLLWRRLSRSSNVARRSALAALDGKLNASDRLVTADAFLDAPEPSGFMQAAIEDASSFATRARQTDVRTPPTHVALNGMQGVLLASAMAMLLAAFWLSFVDTRVDRPRDVEVVRTAAVGPVAEIQPDHKPTPDDEVARESTIEPPSSRDVRDRSRSRSNVPSSSEVPDTAEEAHGSMGTGRTSESDQSSNPSNARGAPSAQGQPSKPGEAPKKKPSTKERRPSDPTQAERPEQLESKPSGATAGQGSSKGSNKNPAASDWSSRDQVSTPDDDEVEEEDDVEDEEEEQESRGGVQPNLRDRRPPVNRDLRIGFGNRNNPDANGRGGPSNQKKSRGVASFVLGVPIADRVKGQTNPGKTKVTQQRIEPEFEPSDPTDAQNRNPRSSQVGPVYHPVMQPWMRAVVKEYFLRQRAATPLQSTQPTDSSDAE